MQRSRCRGGTRNANWPWSNSMQAVGWWAGILELFTNWQLFHGFEYWVLLHWMQSLVRHVLKKPTLAICQVAEMVDPWHGIYHCWWGNAIHSKKQRFGPERSKSAGALVSRQGNMMVEEGPWWCHPLIEFKECKLLSTKLWALMFEFFLWVSGFSAFPFTRSHSEQTLAAWGCRTVGARVFKQTLPIHRSYWQRGLRCFIDPYPFTLVKRFPQVAINPQTSHISMIYDGETGAVFGPLALEKNSPGAMHGMQASGVVEVLELVKLNRLQEGMYTKKIQIRNIYIYIYIYIWIYMIYVYLTVFS